ncbi:guanylate kinase [Parvibaculum sp.]|jgi:guanylate kinase|uniref:guanylate kinase n=1 Tax=Parvibaculum sp. TaxID=2024848 RepID=UPI000C4B7FEB|nr:guanylate kinase [Parvibaculum sp.]HAC60492.1 guanylate kinase [Rhodobiaceae bacterium]MAU60542.1 guanylate kinase [Parvibaculum sp.]MBO6667423.1 guanylate kinase [Parvibaculum sp.]MBO6692367.1 guanylate kinase [Parvibaculum sp.]MBO6713975.1 guanylate kinase [Parvibaculum sp.]|tara:strand:+ start:160 stop:798 length:639 start_codon:yes stop_codon:yes gene_type:complete
MTGIAIHRRGLMLVLSSPSGAGKTTLSRRLLESDSEIEMSVSATTRRPRPGEQDGKDYFFLSTEDFGIMRNRGEFLEHAKVFGNYYGTPRKPVEEALARGRDVLFDIDWQGTQQLDETAPEDLVKVFILPPSVQELEKRLMTRAQDSAEVVASRMGQALDEISHYQEYDYVIINENVDRTFEDLRAILVAERQRRRRLIGLSNFVKQLREAR